MPIQSSQTGSRPELEDHHLLHRSRIDPGLCPVAVLLRIVSGRDAGCCSGAEYLGEIDRAF